MANEPSRDPTVELVEAVHGKFQENNSCIVGSLNLWRTASLAVIALIFVLRLCWSNQRTVAQRGDGPHLVECERSDHETTIAATAPLGAINEVLLGKATAFLM